MESEPKPDGGRPPNWGEEWAEAVSRLGEAHTGECPYPCPFCFGVGVIRQMSPDIADHLVAAGREFILAAKALLDGLAEQTGAERPQRKVERIPLD
jgi:hypothetical protein